MSPSISSPTQRAEFSSPGHPEKLKNHAREIRKKLVQMHFHAKSSHLGTGLSEVDLLTYVFGYYYRPGVDRFILSKGHGASGVYATLDYFNLMPKGIIDTYYKDSTKLAAHPSPLALEHLPIATGSLGHGLSVAAGMALASKVADRDREVICLLSDGECNEGSIWEAALFSAHHKLNNLTVLVDCNGLQGFGRTKDVLNMHPFIDKWRAFGFNAVETDGHDFASIHKAVVSSRTKDLASRADESASRPTVVLAQTVKGKGVSFAENTLEWHYLNLNAEQLAQALKDLEAK